MISMRSIQRIASGGVSLRKPAVASFPPFLGPPPSNFVPLVTGPALH